MRRKLCVILMCFLVLLMSSSVYAATKSSGNLNIVMTYNLRAATDCIQGNPLLCVYLSKNDAHYFVRLNYQNVAEYSD